MCTRSHRCLHDALHYALLLNPVLIPTFDRCCPFDPQLRRLALVSEDIAMVRFALDLPPFSPACQHTLQTLIAVNGWGRGGAA